jgi:hypothetical protein
MLAILFETVALSRLSFQSLCQQVAGQIKKHQPSEPKAYKKDFGRDSRSTSSFSVFWAVLLCKSSLLSWQTCIYYILQQQRKR